MVKKESFPTSFIKKRLHSITGLFLVLYLIEHLFVNSQAALLIGDNGSGFVRAVAGIHDLPYLPLIEIFFLGVPIILHAYLGVIYLFTSEQNYYGGSGSQPHLTYERNRAYTWQRITSWVLLFGIAAHVIHMRFYQYPAHASLGPTTQYMVLLDEDEGLGTLSARLGFTLYDSKKIKEAKENIASKKNRPEGASLAVQEQAKREDLRWLAALQERKIKGNQVIAVTDSFGMAELLMLRETFKMPLMIFLYTIFVLAACYHAFNGLWTFMISWGITLTALSQRWMLRFSQGLMILVAFWGLVTIWGTYWINLKY